jgi:hypothetical protein
MTANIEARVPGHQLVHGPGHNCDDLGEEGLVTLLDRAFSKAEVRGRSGW